MVENLEASMAWLSSLLKKGGLRPLDTQTGFYESYTPLGLRGLFVVVDVGVEANTGRLLRPGTCRLYLSTSQGRICIIKLTRRTSEDLYCDTVETAEALRAAALHTKQCKLCAKILRTGHRLDRARLCWSLMMHLCATKHHSVLLRSAKRWRLI
jgi:hypothetical protein